ncbi:MAG TPA: DUF4843 domain-containing protein [Puia sp.]|nr:DUF4843 domain-containing protein [Puia sp.]
MNTIKTILGALLLVMVLGSCHKEALPIYQQAQNNVFFNFSNGNDSVTYTFAYTPGVLTDTIYLPISISGNRAPKGFSYKVAVSDSGTTAVAGLDYVALQSAYAIPPDSGRAWLPIVLLNNDTLLTQHSVTLNLQLVATSDLGIQLPDIIKAKVIISNKLEKPDWWDRWMTDYSDEKFELFIIATNGVTELANDDATYGLFAPQSLYYIGLMNDLINDPVGWIAKNPDRGYVMEPQSDGTWYFYNSATPSSRIQVIFDPSANRYYFVRKIGGYVAPN